jgi:cellulose synthase/poly-beta-1,6-N-acetylglucosamine synthase-like glycosyltransferase
MSFFLFWLAVGVLIYTFILFPILIIVRGLLFRKPHQGSESTPSVSLIIAAYNEEKSIEAKIKNVLSLDYPRQKLEVLIASDGSADRTEEIVRTYADQDIKLLSLPRQGKLATLNSVVSAAHGDILVFSDANNTFASNAIRALVWPFADPQVGGVAGNQVYLSHGAGSASSEGERSYWDFDQMLKYYQSEAGSVTSATGSIYAIRRALFCNVPPGVPDDFFISANVIAQGFRLVFAREAICYESVAESSDREFSRKVRIITQGLYGVYLMRELLNPIRHGFYSIQIFSHKLLRRLMFLPLIVLFLATPFLWKDGLFYQLVMLAQIGFYSLAFLGWLFNDKLSGKIRKIFTVPFYFCMTYLASLLATLNMLRGHRISFWETQRQESTSTSEL